MYLTIFGKPRYLGLIVAENNIRFEKGEQLLVESSRGTEIAVVAGEITERQEALYRAIDNRQEGQSGNDSGLQNVTFLHKAGMEDLEKEKNNRGEEERVLVAARQVLSRHNLDMKLVDVEYMNDRKKLFLYFTSEQRVDFRAYVRDLAREFRTRIELRQIGVRDESKVVKGIGACGRVCCCSYWLHRFMPIGIKMVKEQNLALNPTKISGLCGRLMCCMSFEQNSYHELWKSLPSHGAKIKTEQGTWILTGVDLATRTCSVHGPEGNISIPVTMYQQFKETLLAGKTWNNEEHGLDEKGQPLTAFEGGAPIVGEERGCSGCDGCRQCSRTKRISDDCDEMRVTVVNVSDVTAGNGKGTAEYTEEARRRHRRKNTRVLATEGKADSGNKEEPALEQKKAGQKNILQGGKAKLPSRPTGSKNQKRRDEQGTDAPQPPAYGSTGGAVPEEHSRSGAWGRRTSSRGFHRPGNRKRPVSEPSSRTDTSEEGKR